MASPLSHAERLHELKVWPAYFDALADGSKPFEVRQNDRDFRVGDVLRLREWDSTTSYSGREVRRRITYVLDDSVWVMPNHVVLGLAGAAALDEAAPLRAERDRLKAELAQLANFNPDWDMLEATRESLREHMAETVALRARVAQLEAAIRWALGEVGEFPAEEPPLITGKYRQRYHWRTELRKRAALTPEAP